MPSSFDPRSGSSGSRSNRRRQQNTSTRGTRRASDSAAVEQSRVSTAPAVSDEGAKIKRAPSSGKRKSVSAKAKANAERQAAKQAKKEAKQAEKEAKLEAKQAQKELKQAQKSVRGKAKDERKQLNEPEEANSAPESAPEESGEGAESTRSSRRRRTSTGSSSPQRVGDIRARERAERNRAQYRKYITRIVLAIVAVLAVLFGSIFLYRSDLLAVKNVNVTGASHLTNYEIAQIAAVPDDSTLLRLDSAGIEDRLRENAWVQDVSVHRVFPDTIELVITEREPGAVVQINKKSRWVISKDGTWLSAANADDWKNEARIKDVSTAMASPISGSGCDDGGILNALAILDGISDDLRKQLKSISAGSSVTTSLNLKGGVTVAFGDSSEIELKEADVWALLNQYKGKISYINVRVPSRPTYRTLSE